MKIPSFDSIILFENNDYLIVNKPAGLSSLDDRNDSVNLRALATAYCAKSQLAHRLDKETSGVLALAKSEEAYRHLSLQFEHRQVEKNYHTVVTGVHHFKNLEVNRKILPAANGLVKIDSKGKASQTFFDTIKVYRSCTLVQCRPITGRTHQIRIHLATINAPIVSDHAYGGQDIYLSRFKRDYKLKKWAEEQPLMKRVALHAHSIHFEGLSGENVQVVAPYPKDFAVLVKQLERYT